MSQHLLPSELECCLFQLCFSATGTNLLSYKDFKKALLLPVIVTGIIPFIIGIMFGYGLLTFVSVGLVVGGTGDIMIYQLIRRHNDSRSSE
ncbi:metalloprotease family protein [Bacillus cereus]|uniref:metalloprotease family protein n=1 Tax=Bacillus cereus TaxID=1396 RepID=UPI0015964308